MKESDLNKKAQDRIKQAGGYVIKTITTNRSGVSDLIACINGRFCSLEGKLPGNKLSQLQDSHAINVIESGGLFIELRSMKDVDTIIEWANSGYIQNIPDSKRVKSFSL